MAKEQVLVEEKLKSGVLKRVKGIWGTFDVFIEKNKITIMKSRKEFKVGDIAEYDSWNLKYTAKITSITQNSVTFDTLRSRGKKTRLQLNEFSYRNQNFDSEEWQKFNHEEMLYL